MCRFSLPRLLPKAVSSSKSKMKIRCSVLNGVLSSFPKTYILCVTYYYYKSLLCYLQLTIYDMYKIKTINRSIYLMTVI